MFGDVNSRAEMFRQRLLLTQQKLLRSGLFVTKGLTSNAGRSDASEVAKERCCLLSLLIPDFSV
jgi:hypothetical protein